MATTVHEAVFSAIRNDATAFGYCGNEFGLGAVPADTVAPYTVMNLVADPLSKRKLCYDTDQGQAVFQFDVVVNAVDQDRNAKWDGLDRRNNLRQWIVTNVADTVSAPITITNVVVNDIVDRETETNLVAYGFEATVKWRA